MTMHQYMNVVLYLYLVMGQWPEANNIEGDLSKKSIHINESFVHAIYIGIVVNSYSDIVAYI